MKDNFQQFDNSITDKVEHSMNQWTKELADMNQKLMNDSIQIIDALNDKQNICTPGFLMRRQIQTVFPKLLKSVSKEINENYEDLFLSNNVPWSDNFIKCLSSKLEKQALTQGQSVRASQWISWLEDESFPERNLAVKLSFLLDMDDYTTTKFLLSCGKEPLSVRNPFDYICLFCKQLRPKGDWNKVEELLKKYEKNRPNDKMYTSKKRTETGTIGMTNIISGKIPKLASIDVPEYQVEDLQDDLIEYMYSIDAEFTHRKVTSKKDTKTDRPYASGYSLERCQNLRELTKYLAVLYPIYDNSVYVGGDRRVDSRTKKKGENAFASKYAYSKEDLKKVRFEKDYPNIKDLSKAFVYSREWDFAEPSGLGLVDINVKTGKAYKTSSKKKNHDKKIPFNSNVYMICKSYAENKRLREILLNEIPVERKDILLLSYLFIIEYSRQIENTSLINRLYNMADVNSEKDIFSYKIREILGQLNEVLNMWDSEKISGYISCINQFLQLFNFQEFYPPFVLDRFILFALVGEEMGSISVDKDESFKNLTGIWLYDGYANDIEE